MAQDNKIRYEQLKLVFGTNAGDMCEGNDSRLSDTRIPTDSSVTYAKIDETLTQRATDNDGAWDFSANGIVDAAFSSGATTVSFTNLQLNKVLKVKLVITNSATFTLPAYCIVQDGSAAASGTNGTYYLYFDCWNATTSSEEVLVTITNAQA